MNKNNLLNIILLSLYNTIYKYIIVKQNLSNYYNNSGLMGTYITSSSTEIPYAKIFIYTIISLIIINITYIIIIRLMNKQYDINHIPLTLTIVLSAALLFINILIGQIVLLIGILIYLYINKKNKPLIIQTIISIITLYIISY